MSKIVEALKKLPRWHLAVTGGLVLWAVALEVCRRPAGGTPPAVPLTWDACVISCRFTSSISSAFDLVAARTPPRLPSDQGLAAREECFGHPGYSSLLFCATAARCCALKEEGASCALCRGSKPGEPPAAIGAARTPPLPPPFFFPPETVGAARTRRRTSGPSARSSTRGSRTKSRGCSRRRTPPRRGRSCRATASTSPSSPAGRPAPPRPPTRPPLPIEPPVGGPPAFQQRRSDSLRRCCAASLWRLWPTVQPQHPFHGICCRGCPRQGGLPISLNNSHSATGAFIAATAATAAKVRDSSRRHAPGWVVDGDRPPASSRPPPARRHCMSGGRQESHYEVLGVPRDATDSAIKVSPSCSVSYLTALHLPSDQMSDPVLCCPGGGGLQGTLLAWP